MENENLFNLIWGILKAIFWFVFRLALLVPMVFITFMMAVIGANKSSIGEAIWKCILHPFSAFGEAIRNISYEIKIYKSNK